MNSTSNHSSSMLLRVSLVILALSVVAVSHNVDDVVPEVMAWCEHHNRYESLIPFPSNTTKFSEPVFHSKVTLVHDEVVEKEKSSIAHQCFLLRSKTAVQAAVSDGSGTGGEVETPTEKMEASSSFECSKLCSQEPADSDFKEMMGFQSAGHESGSSFICRGHPAHASG